MPLKPPLPSSRAAWISASTLRQSAMPELCISQAKSSPALATLLQPQHRVIEIRQGQNAVFLDQRQPERLADPPRIQLEVLCLGSS